MRHSNVLLPSSNKVTFHRNNQCVVDCVCSRQAHLSRTHSARPSRLSLSWVSFSICCHLMVCENAVRWTRLQSHHSPSLLKCVLQTDVRAGRAHARSLSQPPWARMGRAAVSREPVPGPRLHNGDSGAGCVCVCVRASSRTQEEGHRKKGD